MMGSKNDKIIYELDGSGAWSFDILCKGMKAGQ